MTDTLTAKVQQAKADSVFYYRAANQWSIFKTDRGKCLGVLPFDINAGDPLSMKGKWKRSDYNGEEEFHFTDVVLDVPTDLRALLTYAVEITNGLGPAAEEKIWEQYGEEWRGVEVLEIP